ncbi:MAG: metallophosphoesterase [Planctomycetes bacterium]|nr:metallophosphoesterase [Planctomycetota bacterium]
MPEKRTNRRGFLKAAGAAAIFAWMAVWRWWGPASSSDALPDTGDDPARRDLQALMKVPEGLFRPTRTGCVLQWVPNATVEARVLAGPTAKELDVVKQIISADPAEITLSNARSGEEFFFQMQYRRPGDSEWLHRPVRRVQTQRSAGESFRVALIADSHVYHAHRIGQDMTNLSKTCDRVLADRPDFVVFLGDEAGVHYLKDPPGFMNQQRAYERWALWRNSFADVIAAVPTYMVLGNHEGEAGYYQQHRMGKGPVGYLQRWGTIARKRYCLNPLPDTYPEGGENENWKGDPTSPATGGAGDGNASPLQNYYAWTWGDALFVVLDVHRYTNPGGGTPSTVDQWTLGAAQMRWLDKVLTTSPARWKFVITHHLVGGWEWNLRGDRKGGGYLYGRGGAKYARIGEQARITDLMKRTGAQCVFYGHDHIFAHQKAEGIHFVCCGRPTYLNPQWWSTPAWKEAYGNTAKRNPNDFHAAIGYTRLTVSPQAVHVEYIRTGTDRTGKENVTTPEGQVVDRFPISA